MLRNLTYFSIALLMAVLFTSAILSDNGKAGKAGSPGETTCTGCHNDFALNSGGGSVVLSGITGTTYTPGTTYSMRVTVSRSGSSLFGLGCEALTSSNTNAGTLIITNAAETQLMNATIGGVVRTSVTHQFAGGLTSNSHAFNFNWTAPSAGAGPVTFYFSGLAGDNDGGTGGDYVYNSSITFTEASGCTTPAQPGTISGTTAVCSGVSQTYSVASVTGATDYIWTLPSGWSGSSTTNSITVTTGSTSGNIQVAAHNTCGTSAVRTLAVTSTTAVVPSISIASGSGTSICSGTSVTFTASPANGGSSPIYQWKVNGANVGSNTPTYTTSTLSNGNTISCVMTSNATCATTTTATSNTLTMSVASAVVPSVSISSSAGTTFCSGTNVTFTANATNGGSTPSYQWKKNGIVVGAASTYSSSSLVTGDIITCVLTSSSTCASPTTATSNSLTITVNNTVTPSVSINSSVGNIICSGTSVAFTATPANGGASPSYQWKVNGNNVATSSTFSTSSLSNNDQVTCVLTSSLGCVTSPTATSNTITMTVSPTVAPSVTIQSAAGNAVCSGSSVTFTATPSNGGTTPAYQWFVNGTPSGSNSTSFVTSLLQNNDIVSCQMTSNAMCSSTSTASSNTITMSVSNQAAPAVSISSNSGTTICSGTTVTFSALPVNGGTAPSYQWLIDGMPVGTNSSTYSTNQLLDGNQISCVMTSNSTCATTPTATSSAITMTVTNFTQPSITSSGSTSFCQGGSVILSATTADTYNWSPGGQTTQSITVTTSGNYSVNVTEGNCNGTSSTTSITVTPQPVVTFSSLPDVCSTDQPFALTGGNPAGGIYSGDAVTNGLFDPAQATNDSTWITYTYASTAGCTDSATSLQVITICDSTSCGTFVAYTQNQWGSPSSNSSVVNYLMNNFMAAFPNGLQIGDCGRQLRFTSPLAIRNFLPANGNSRPLSAGTLVDPSRNQCANSFAAQLVTLNLNINFDQYDTAFAPSGVALKDAVIARGPFAGWTVLQLFLEANHVIGCVGTNSYINELTLAMKFVNNENPSSDDPYIVCPDDALRMNLQPISPIFLSLTAFPNPVKDVLYLNYQLTNPGDAVITVYDITGREVYTRTEDHARSGEFTIELPLRANALPNGLYLIRLIQLGRTAEIKVILGE